MLERLVESYIYDGVYSFCGIGHEGEGDPESGSNR